MTPGPRTGTLYVVATPLGHLGDLSARAVDVLCQVPVVAAEDTRRTRPLLDHVGSAARLISYHAHSSEHRQDTLLEILREGRDVALVSDAGTPGISDPGAELVAAVRQAGVRVVPVPGPSAVTAALSASGLPADRYLMLGFPPRQGRARERLLAEAVVSAWTVVFYESPQRLVALLEDLAALAGPRPAAVARELTKLHEDIRTASLPELAVHYAAHPPLGECTVLLAGRGERPPAEDEAGLEETARTLAERLLAEGQSRKDVVRALGEELGLSRNAAYRLVMGLP